MTSNLFAIKLADKIIISHMTHTGRICFGSCAMLIYTQQNKGDKEEEAGSGGYVVTQYRLCSPLFVVLSLSLLKRYSFTGVCLRRLSFVSRFVITFDWLLYNGSG